MWLFNCNSVVTLFYVHCKQNYLQKWTVESNNIDVFVVMILGVQNASNLLDILLIF